MLAKGEVEEIIVRPDLEIVTIILYDGAIIKGRRVSKDILIEKYSPVLFIFLLYIPY